MKIPNIGGVVKVGKAFILANRPELLFGASVTATVASVALAAKGGYDARGIIDAERMKRVASPEPPFDTFLDYHEEFIAKAEPIPVKEKIQLTWLCYMPAAATTITAIGSTTGLHLVHIKEKKQMAAAALLALDEAKKAGADYLEDYKASVEENAKLTDKKRNAIDDSTLEKNADRNGGVAKIQNTDGVIEELYLVRDAKTGRDIWSNENRIQEAVNNVNAFLAKNGDMDLNTFYSNAGFATTPDGDDWGWSGTQIELVWTTTVRDDGRPVKQFAFLETPKSGTH